MTALPLTRRSTSGVAARTGLSGSVAVVVGAYVVLVATLVGVGLLLVHLGALGSLRRWDDHLNVSVAAHRTPALTRLTPPPVSHLIAIAAPVSRGRHAYTLADLTLVLRTALTGFAAAVLESRRLWPSSPVVI